MERETCEVTTPSRIVTPERRSDDVGDTALRPQLLSEFVGQAQARKNLSIFIEAARKRNEALDHVLFVGPPGLGKTTLAQIVARELGVGFRATSGPVIAKAGDLAALLTNLTLGVAREFATQGIRCLSISPGPIRTPFQDAAQTSPEIVKRFLDDVPMKRFGEPEEIGELVLFMCSDACGFMTGDTVMVNGGGGWR